MPVLMELRRIIINEIHEQHIVLLHEVDGERAFPIVIGTFEALSIDRRIKGVQWPRPMTHDLICSAIYQLGGAGDVSATTLYRHGNYDVVNADTVWDPDVTSRGLPPSLYRTRIPGWWPSGVGWPWVGPELMPRIGELPAKTRAATLPGE